MATEGRGGGGSLSNSLTDLMTSLMVIFVLLLVATLNNASEEGANTRSLMLDKLTQELKDFEKQGVSVKQDPRDPLGLLVLVPEKALKFDENESKISIEGEEFLSEFVPRFAKITCNERFHDEIGSIVVEGYTNSNGTDEYNLGLSQSRSLAVVQQTLGILGNADAELKALGKEDAELKNCFLDFLSANGRGSRDPVLDGNGKEDKERSRRVQFKIRVRSFEERHQV
jgi:outer membrane protein OmpA-like peptidoglycan-associated protein